MNRILIVDDEHLVADTLTAIFRKHGFDTRVAYSADEALAEAHVFHPDLLLCDITMPVRNGLELMADICRDLPATRVLVLTGHYSNLKGAAEQARKMSCPTGILTKPCDPLALIREAGAMLATA